MKDPITRQRFVQLRAEGWTLRHISEQLDVAESTLALWLDKHEDEIRRLTAIHNEAMLAPLVQTESEYHKRQAEWLQRVDQEIEKRDLSTLSLRGLFSLRSSMRRDVMKFTNPYQTSAPCQRAFGKPDFTTGAQASFQSEGNYVNPGDDLDLTEEQRQAQLEERCRLARYYKLTHEEDPTIPVDCYSRAGLPEPTPEERRRGPDISPRPPHPTQLPAPTAPAAPLNQHPQIQESKNPEIQHQTHPQPPHSEIPTPQLKSPQPAIPLGARPEGPVAPAEKRDITARVIGQLSPPIFAPPDPETIGRRHSRARQRRALIMSRYYENR